MATPVAGENENLVTDTDSSEMNGESIDPESDVKDENSDLEPEA